MKKLLYLEAFLVAAHWFLPSGDAAEVKARISDARWQAMLILCLGIVGMCAHVLPVICNMDSHDITLHFGWPLLYPCLLTAVVCLGLTGKSLC